MSTFYDDQDDDSSKSGHPNLSPKGHGVKQPDSQSNTHPPDGSDSTINHPHAANASKNMSTGSDAAAKASAGNSAAAGTAANSASTGAAAGSASGSVAAGAAAGGVAAAPIILIILGVLLCILLICTFFVVLTPENTTHTAIEYTKQVEESLSNFFKRLFGISDNVVQIEADETQYDTSNEYDVAFINNYNAINTALNASYTHCVEQYVRSYCTSNGYSYHKTIDLLNETYPNGWRDVYSNVNYGELICVLSLGYQSGAYGNVSFGDTTALSNFLLAESNWHAFYNITGSAAEPDSEITDVSEISAFSSIWSQLILSTATIGPNNLIQDTLSSETQQTESPESTESTYDVERDGAAAVISIYPFCLKDLFAALNIDKDAHYYTDADLNITYYDMLQLMMSQIAAISENAADGTYRQIYYTLGLDKPSATWDYGFSSSTVSGIFTNSLVLPVTGDNAEIIWQYLKNAGFTDAGASAILGNLMAENGLRTTMAGEGGSVGLAQWTNGRKDRLIAYAGSLNLPVTDIHAQAGFLVLELSSSGYDMIRNCTDVTTAADYTAYYYERCSRYASYEAYSQGRYAGIISWSRYKYSSVMNTYIVDLDSRQRFSMYYYDLYSGS